MSIDPVHSEGMTPGPRSHVRSSRVGSVAVLTLDRPEASNAIDPKFVDDLFHAVSTLPSDARAVLINATGPRFSVGGDLKFLNRVESNEIGSTLVSMTDTFHGSMAMLHALDVPVVVAARGAVAGGALGFVGIADIALATHDTQFATVRPINGLPLDGGASWFLPRILGMRLATEMFLEGRVLLGEEAAEAGLITRLVSEESLDEESMAVTIALANRYRRASALTMELFKSAFDDTLEVHLGRETDAMREAAAEFDGRQPPFVL